MVVAAVQWKPLLGAPKKNRRSIVELTRAAVNAGATLVVFPECSSCGYMLASEEEAVSCAEPADGPTYRSIHEVCRQLQVCVACGILELWNDKLYNSAILVGPDGLLGVYRKVHIPSVGVDRFVQPGQALPVFATSAGSLGILICYDIRFPEAARTLAVRGCQALLVLANWPEGAESNAQILSRARACENNMYVIAANRVGIEAGIRFVGMSRVIAPDGHSIVESMSDEETIIVADIELGRSGLDKEVYVKSSGYTLNFGAARRPEVYNL